MRRLVRDVAGTPKTSNYGVLFNANFSVAILNSYNEENDSNSKRNLRVFPTSFGSFGVIHSRTKRRY